MGEALSRREPGEQSASQAVPLRSAASSRLIEFLRQQDVGVTVPYAEIRNILRKDPQRDGRGMMDSAIRYVRDQDSAVWGTVRGLGIKRLNPDESVALARNRLDKARRQARTSGKILEATDYERLDESGKSAHNAAMAVGRLVGMMTRKSGVEKVRKALGSQALPDPGEVLRLFASK